VREPVKREPKIRLRRVPEIVSPAVMAHVSAWEECSKRMLTEYGAPTSADAEWADGIIFGTPTRFGNTSAELKAFIDSLGGLWLQGRLNGKAANAVTDRQRFLGRTAPTLDFSR
jgi:NAD(P)H dehydrogenase (quinone)